MTLYFPIKFQLKKDKDRKSIMDRRAKGHAETTGSGKEFRCPKCPKAYTTLRAMKNHAASHTQTKVPATNFSSYLIQYVLDKMIIKYSVWRGPGRLRATWLKNHARIPSEDHVGFRGSVRALRCTQYHENPSSIS